MALEGDRALSARPEQFELVVSPSRARFFRLSAVAAPVLPLAFAVFAFVNGDLAFGVIAAVMAVGAPLVMLWLAGQSREWRLRDGRALRALTLALNEDPDQAWRRLDTGDPTQYTPLKVQASAENVRNTLEAYWPDGEPVTYVVIVRGRGREGVPSEIIELRDAQHVAFHTARENGLQKVYTG